MLQPIVDTIESIATNKTDVIRQLDDLKLEEPFVLVTFDVVAMYPSIDLLQDINILQKYLSIIKIDFSV